MVCDGADREIGTAKETMLETHYSKYKNSRASEDMKNSSWYRYFFPLDAKYEIKGSTYGTHHPNDMYNGKTGYYPSFTNNFRDHH